MEKQKESKPSDRPLSECGYWSRFFEVWAGKEWSGKFFKESAEKDKLPAKKEK